MIFNKLALLAMLAVSTNAADRNLRVNRDLNKCPVDYDIELMCTVLLDKKPVGMVGSDGSIVLNDYDPKGCYNIECSSSDNSRSARIVWEGFVENARGQTETKTSNKAPYFLSGYIDGTGCTKLAESCEDLDITVKAIRAPDPNEPNNFDGYICDELKITCKTPPKPKCKCPDSSSDSSDSSSGGSSSSSSGGSSGSSGSDDKHRHLWGYRYGGSSSGSGDSSSGSGDSSKSGSDDCHCPDSSSKSSGSSGSSKSSDSSGSSKSSGSSGSSGSSDGSGKHL